MAQHKEFSSIRPPMCNLDNLALWKARIKLFMNAINEEIFDVILTGSSPQTKNADAQAMNILAQSMSDDIFQQVAECNSARDIWTSLSNIVKKPESPINSSEDEETTIDEMAVYDSYDETEDNEEDVRLCMMAISASRNKSEESEHKKESERTAPFTTSLYDWTKQGELLKEGSTADAVQNSELVQGIYADTATTVKEFSQL